MGTFTGTAPINDPYGGLTVPYTSPGYIGKYFAWTVKSNGVSTKTVGCMNPGSTKPRKAGHCTG